jgi:RimJ/RimL family protein N-acetyltransferase
MFESPEITTKRFRLASITPSNVSDEWLRWAADEKLMRQMNAPLRKLSRADLQHYVADSRRLGRVILGIYERRGGAHVGSYETELNDRHRLATVDVLVDQERFDLSNVLKETDPALLSYLAGRCGTHKAVVKIVDTHAAALRHFEATGWRKEGILRQERPAFDGGRRVDVIQFGKLLIPKDGA